MKILRKLLVMVIVSSFISAGCGRLSNSNVRQNNSINCIDTDSDGICDDAEIDGNPTTHIIPCQREDGTVEYLDCTVNPDCNCNSIPDNEEPETTAHCSNKNFDCWPGWVKWTVGIGGSLAAIYGGYRAGEALNWFRGYGPDIAVNSIDWGASELTFSPNKMYMKVVGQCRTDDKLGHCEFELASRVIYPTISGQWSEVQPIGNQFYSGSTLKYFFNLRESPVNGSSENYIKVKGTNGNGDHVEYILKSPSWLGIRTTTDTANEVAMAVSYFTRSNPSDNPSLLMINAYSDPTKTVFFSTDNPVARNSNYIHTTWHRVDMPPGFVVPPMFDGDDPL